MHWASPIKNDVLRSEMKGLYKKGFPLVFEQFGVALLFSVNVKMNPFFFNSEDNDWLRN